MVSAANQLKILAPDDKKRLSDMLDYDGIIALDKTFPATKANRFSCQLYRYDTVGVRFRTLFKNTV
ncbi:hypothetical protein SAMN05661044_04611 [Olivibacter domesticus]|uniref:Uncharacterized protein n=1 Tax=Olivibacter domesticus TaxID=407022 RepID=A0A1H7WRN1_OLID1|nr:hypothetical protein SAMN05661044_04611 [Olivibacter domesticus]